ncbi:MAG: hypothetical protein ACFFEF_01510 [Candidatus Thorarchaeota archaeon]
MSREGVLFAIVLITVLCAAANPVSALRIDTGYTWESGLSIGVHVENLDYWVLDQPGEIFLRFNLRGMGELVYLGKLEISFYIDVGILLMDSVEIIDPWANTSVLDVTLRPIIQSSWINDTSTDYFLLDYYLRFNQTGRYEGATYLTEFYTTLNGPHPINLSKLEFYRYWPFPPIILMGCIYWFGFLGLRRFNKRYERFRFEPVVQKDTYYSET